MSRTNNSIEGWHNKLSSFVGCHHPQFFKFLGFLKKEQVLQDINVIQINSGMDIQRKNKKFITLNVRLMKVVQSYNVDDWNNYLDAVAHCIYV